MDRVVTLLQHLARLLLLQEEITLHCLAETEDGLSREGAGSKVSAMEQELNLRIILEGPPPGIDFGLQEGGGNDYQTVQTQRSKTGDLSFEFSVRVREGKDGKPNFLGPFVQGPPQKRFVYIDIGTYAGQHNTQWSRRLKVPLSAITWELIRKGKTLETHIAGTGGDGGPTCATPKPFNGWQAKK